MNIVQSSTLPTISFFNKAILDSLGIWGGDVVDVEFDVMATEDQRRKALNLVFEEHKKPDGSYGPISSVLKSMEDNAPQSHKLQRRTRTIQDLVQHFAKEDFRSSFEFDELEPYIQEVIKEKFSDPILSEFVISTRRSLIEHYKEFVREFIPNDAEAINGYLLFLTHIAVEVICKSLFSTLSYSYSLEDLNCAAISFGSQKDNKEIWPLKAYFDELLKSSQVSAYKLHQFHEFQLNNPNLADVDIWKKINPADLTNTKSKQVVARFNRKNKMNWNKVWQQISPIISRLPVDEKIVKLNSFVAQWIHNLVINIEPVSECEDALEGILASIYKSIEYSKEKYLAKQNTIYLKPISDVIDDFADITFAESGGTRDIETSEFLITCKVNQDKYRSWLASSKFYASNSLSSEFTNFWCIDTEENIDVKKLSVVVEASLLNSFSSWVKYWSEARRSMIEGDMKEALQYFKLSLSHAKYGSGRYFASLYIDICAFCKMMYQYFSARNEADIFERFYDELGSHASKYSNLLGYKPKWMRDPKTLAPSYTNQLKNSMIVKMIDLTVVKMQQLQSSNRL